MLYLLPGLECSAIVDSGRLYAVQCLHMSLPALMISQYIFPCVYSLHSMCPLLMFHPNRQIVPLDTFTSFHVLDVAFFIQSLTNGSYFQQITDGFHISAMYYLGQTNICQRQLFCLIRTYDKTCFPVLLGSLFSPRDPDPP